MKDDLKILCELKTFTLNLKNLSLETKDKLRLAINNIQKEENLKEKDREIENLNYSIVTIKTVLEELIRCKGKVESSDVWSIKKNFKYLSNLRTRDFLNVSKRIYDVLLEYCGTLEDELSELKKEK
jgi:hypothetical protein